MKQAAKLRVPTAWKVREPYSGLPRIPFVQRCRLEGRHGVREGLICDLSIVGVYLGVEPVPEPAELFQLTFRLPADEAPIVVDAAVMWHNLARGGRVRDLPPGCGLRFLGLRPPDRERLHALIKAYTASFRSAPAERPGHA